MRKWLENKLLKYLLTSVDEESVVTTDKAGNIFCGGEPLTDREKNNLIEEVKYLKETHVWKLLTNTLASQAQKVMFERSQSFDDMRTGKAMLYCISVQKNIVDRIENLILK